MTNRENLQENYEDSLFALLMDDFARQEGERLLQENEALKKDPAAAVPEAVTRHCLQTIRRELFRRRHGISARRAGRALRRFAVAAVLVVALFTAAFAASPAFRTGTLNMLLTFSEKAATWQSSFLGGRLLNTDDDIATSAKLQRLPEGYEVSDVEMERFRETITYSNQAGEEIELTSSITENSGFSLDIENPDYYEETTIHGYPAIVVDKLGFVRIAWAEEDLGLFIYMDATDLSVEELKALAETVVFN